MENTQQFIQSIKYIRIVLVNGNRKLTQAQYCNSFYLFTLQAEESLLLNRSRVLIILNFGLCPHNQYHNILITSILDRTPNKYSLIQKDELRI